MEITETPLSIEGINDSLYAGFWARLGAMLLDLIFVLPVVVVIQYINGFGKNIFFITIILNLLFAMWYNIYLPKKHGGTPGKLAVGNEIIRLDGKPLEWKDAFMRNVVMLGLSILSALLLAYCLLKVDDETYKNLSWIHRNQYLMSMAPLFFKLYTWTSNIWVYSEFIVLLTNKRKRAIHDYIAGTVIVKSLYVMRIREYMSSTSNDQNESVEGEFVI